MNTFDLVLGIISSIALAFFLKAALEDLKNNMNKLKDKRARVLKKEDDEKKHDELSLKARRTGPSSRHPQRATS